MLNIIKDKTFVIMGGGTAGWLSAMHFLNASYAEELNLNVVLVASSEIPIIGVGEGTTMVFKNFLEMCVLDKNEFLRKTKGSFKYGIEFNNWNFDGKSYYHTFNPLVDETVMFYQYCLNNDITDDYDFLQSKLHGRYYEICKNNKLDLEMWPAVAYHFSAPLLVKYFEEQCKKYSNFTYVDATIHKINYYENGYIDNLELDEGKILKGDFYINCLGLRGRKLLHEEYYDCVEFSHLIPNNRAVTVQVSREPEEEIKSCTVAKAEDYGWTWDIPLYERTGYGYVYSSHFCDDEDKIYNDLIKSHNINEKNIIARNKIDYETYYNKKHLHKNCLSVGLAAGFVEPLEATSIHLTLTSLHAFNQFLYNRNSYSDKLVEVFNQKRSHGWVNTIKNIAFHYLNEIERNDYWKHFNDLVNIAPFNNFYEMYYPTNGKDVFNHQNYFAISLGLRKKNYYYTFYEENVELPSRIRYFFAHREIYDYSNMPNHKQVLDDLHGKC